jgi:hypothetical protein
MADGTEADLIEHLRQVHQKGTRGFTEAYLARLHGNLHQRGSEHAHTHPEPEPAASAAEG